MYPAALPPDPYSKAILDKGGMWRGVKQSEQRNGPESITNEMTDDFYMLQTHQPIHGKTLVKKRSLGSPR